MSFAKFKSIFSSKMVFAGLFSLSLNGVTLADDQQPPVAPPTNGESLLTMDGTLPSFGKVRYKAPLEANQGLPIVMFHGIYGGASHRAFRELLPQLETAGKRVYIMDLSGAGESDKPKRAYNIADVDQFIEEFLVNIVKERSTVVAESISSVSALTVAAKRPDLIRRLVLLSPSGVKSLQLPPSEREQRLYDRLFKGPDQASTAFYENLLNDNSLKYFLSFGFSDDSKVDESLLADYRVMRSNTDQKWITLSFVGGQLYRSFETAVQGVFVPTLVLLGADYEKFGDNEPTRAEDFQAIRPDFEYLEIAGSGSSVQREKPEATAKEILTFSVED